MRIRISGTLEVIAQTVHILRSYFQGRAVAYNRVFDRQSVFTETVLKDLARFCRAHQSTFNPDPRIQAMLEGRREVWLRIQEQLQMTVDEIYLLHVAKEKPQKD